MFYYLIFICITILIVDQFRPRKLVKLHKTMAYDGSYIPILGQGHIFFGNNEDKYNCFYKIGKQMFDKEDGTFSLWLGFKFIIGIVDPIQAVAVLKYAFDQSFFYKFSKFLMGDAIVFAPADIWHRKRKILAPTFAPRNVSRLVSVFEKNAKILTQILDSKVSEGNFSSWQYICNYGLDSICETILGVKIGALSKPDHPFSKAFSEHFKNVANRICNPLLHMDVLYNMLPVHSRQKQTKKIIYDFIDNTIYKTKKEMAENLIKSNNDSSKFRTFLELMVQSSEENDKSYTHEELREESVALVLAGTDTSATGLAFTLLLLSQHQDVQQKVYEELESVLGDRTKPIIYEDLQKLKYLEAVIKETLRLYPPIPLIPRDSPKDFPLPSGLIVPSRCDVIIHIMAIQRNPRYWGEDAEEFKPERFLTGTPQTPGAFMAFGHGSRNCPGQLYAMLSIKTTVVTLLRQYNLLPATSFKYDKNNPLRLSFEIMVKHVDKFDMKIEYRNKSKVNRDVIEEIQQNGGSNIVPSLETK